jgi:tRNA pseudouridine55 synthase
MAAPDGLLIVDKPAGWTSHDVVSRCRRLAGTRKVGHAGTLDPMATGVLVVGVGRATRLLGYLALTTKAYDATIRLGRTTVTDDAEGEVLRTLDASQLTDDAVAAAIATFHGEIEQVPSSVSAVKIKGQRAYARVREGEDVELPPRRVRIDRLAVGRIHRVGDFVDVDVEMECSTGTYVRALARDVGALLEVGGHLTALRRTRVGSHRIQESHTLAELAGVEPQELPVLPLDEAARDHFAWCVVDGATVAAVRNGRPLPLELRRRAGCEEEAASTAAVGTPGPQHRYDPGERGTGPDGPVAVLAPGGRFLALYEQHGPVATAVAVFAPA